MVEIQIGVCTDSMNVVNKNPDFKYTVSCRIKGDCSVESPVFILNARNNYINCNYLYCRTWDKYYFFANPPTVSEAGTMEINCEEDVLMTFREDIKKMRLNIVRASAIGFTNSPDTGVLIDQKKKEVVHKFGINLSDGLSASSRCYLLTIAQ